MDGNHVMVPLKFLMDYAGFNASVVASDNNVTVKDKGHTYEFTLNSDKAKVDGKEVTISKALYQKDGYTFISLDVVKNNMNHGVTHDTDNSWNTSISVEEKWSR